MEILLVVVMLLVASPCYASSVKNMKVLIRQSLASGTSPQVVLQTLWDGTRKDGLTVDQLVRLTEYVKKSVKP